MRVQGAGLPTQFHGVTVRTYRLETGFLFCLAANPGTKIAAQYGVEFKVPPREQKLWSEQFPKLVTRDQTYFDLPVGVELKASNEQRKRHVNLHLGICVDARYCEPIDIPITLPSADETRRDGPCEG